MPEPDKTLEGWSPEPGPDLPLERIIDLAFDYRGNTTVVLRDGTELTGYVFNRNADVAEPFVQMFGADGGGPLKIPYARIRTIRFTGRDTAAGNSYAAWLERREKARSSEGASTAPSEPPPEPDCAGKAGARTQILREPPGADRAAPGAGGQ